MNILEKMINDFIKGYDVEIISYERKENQIACIAYEFKGLNPVRRTCDMRTLKGMIESVEPKLDVDQKREIWHEYSNVTQPEFKRRTNLPAPKGVAEVIMPQPKKEPKL